MLLVVPVYGLFSSCPPLPIFMQPDLTRHNREPEAPAGLLT
jgi:hypothetical protein